MEEQERDGSRNMSVCVWHGGSYLHTMVMHTIHGMECVHEIVSQWTVTKLMEYNFLQSKQSVISDDDDKAAHLIC